MGYGSNRGKNRGYRSSSGNRSGGYQGFRSYSNPNFQRRPVEAGKEYNLEITELSKRGEGVGKIEGFVIFVPNTKAGQKVRVKIERVGPRFASGSVVGSSVETTGSESETRASSSSLVEPVTEERSSGENSDDSVM